MTNVANNCIDRHLPKRANQTAIIWEGDDPAQVAAHHLRRTADEVCRFANVLQGHGVKKGDRVTIYLPMIPEAAYAMLACARIGAIHSVVFGGFSPDALAGRIEDAQSERRDHRRRRPARRPQGAAQGQCRRAAEKAAGVKNVLVVRRTGGEVDWKPGRDVWIRGDAPGPPPTARPSR